jgi:hypothetical protein
LPLGCMYWWASSDLTLRSRLSEALVYSRSFCFFFVAVT